jgi:transposase
LHDALQEQSFGNRWPNEASLAATMHHFGSRSPPLAALVACGLDRLPRVPLSIVGDRGYSSHVFRDRVWGKGARPAISTRSNEAAIACPNYIYNNRNLIERLWGRLKEWRAVATRYEKTAASYLGVLCLAATADGLKT